MLLPHLKKEKELFSRGHTAICGVDEAGRGSWAGPLVAGAIVFHPEHLKRQWDKKLIRDSKLLSPDQRERAFEYISGMFEFAFGIVESDVIDDMGVGRANQLAMQRALEKFSVSPEYVLADGRGFRFEQAFENIIGGDAKIFSIAAASIVAKVMRDNIMREYDAQYGQYQFSKHKGYGTLLHKKLLGTYGVCPIHRRSFAPIAQLLGK